ncbi:MAG: DUF6062 family protein [Chloroflexi bacterium]|nr:DUF6062 family protein [Chloroflexota bacterium]
MSHLFIARVVDSLAHVLETGRWGRPCPLLGQQRNHQRQVATANKGQIRGLLALEGCPICNLCAEDLRRFYFWYLNEYYGEGVWVGKIIQSGGFCPQHAWELVRYGDAYRISVVYQYLTRDTLAKLRQFLQELGEANSRIVPSQTKRRKALKRQDELPPSGTCPACENVATTARWGLRNLLLSLEDAEIAELYHHSSGLCMRHLWMALEIDEEAVLKEIVRDQIARLESLERELEDYFHKTNYRFRHEPRGEEQTAWLRAVELFAGQRPPLSERP